MSQCYTQFPEDTTPAQTSTAPATRTSTASTTQPQDETTEITTSLPESESSYLGVKATFVIFLVMLI